MKRIISIFLVLLIVFNAGGYLFVYFQLVNHFKQVSFNKINDFIPEKELLLIKIAVNSSDYTNEDVYDRVEDREFKYYGKMHDIFQEELKNDTLYLYCVSDENEDIIHNAFATYVNDKKNDNQNKPILNIIKIFITIALTPKETNINLIDSYKRISNLYLISYQNYTEDVPSPPPKFYL